jgi:5-hydroxyisourate hydrolase-like protein (transthyretin family)
LERLCVLSKEEKRPGKEMDCGVGRIKADQMVETKQRKTNTKGRIRRTKRRQTRERERERERGEDDERIRGSALDWIRSKKIELNQ